MEKPTKAAVLAFCDYSVMKGLMNGNSGGALKSAVARILEDYAPDADLSGIDVPSEVIRYKNRHPNALSPESLQAYQRRVQQALRILEDRLELSKGGVLMIWSCGGSTI